MLLTTFRTFVTGIFINKIFNKIAQLKYSLPRGVISAGEAGAVSGGGMPPSLLLLLVIFLNNVFFQNPNERREEQIKIQIHSSYIYEWVVFAYYHTLRNNKVLQHTFCPIFLLEALGAWEQGKAVTHLPLCIRQIQWNYFSHILTCC